MSAQHTPGPAILDALANEAKREEAAHKQHRGYSQVATIEDLKVRAMAVRQAYNCAKAVQVSYYVNGRRMSRAAVLAAIAKATGSAS